MPVIEHQVDTDVDTLIDATGEPGEQAGEETPEVVLTATQQRKQSLATVFAILGQPVPGQAPTDATTGAPARKPGVPSARSRAALETFAQCTTLEELQQRHPDLMTNLKPVISDLLDWHPSLKSTRATKGVIRAIGTALAATGEDGSSRYPQAVEMLGYAAAVSPVLEPDRLARLIDEAPKVDTAFAPDRYMLQMATALRKVLDNYSGKRHEQRREQLLISLWHTAHDGRWWDVTSGIQPPTEGVAEGLLADAIAREAVQGVVNDANMAGVGAADEHAGDVVAEIMSGNAAFTEVKMRDMVNVKPTQEFRDFLAKFNEDARAGRAVSPDIGLLVSAIPWATPAERAESPVSKMASVIVDLLQETDANGEPLVQLPEKPKTWAEMYTQQASLGLFPFPRSVFALHGQVIGNVTVEVVRNEADLQANRQYMGNCTYGYLRYMEENNYVLFRLWDGRTCYNASITRWRGGGWAIGEVNSKGNHGGVPAHVRQVAEALVRAVDVAYREAEAAAR